MEEDCVFEALWFSIVPLQILGTNPLVLRKDKFNRTYKFSFIGFAYIAVVISCLLSALYITYQVFPEIIQKGDLNLLIIMMKIRVIGGPLCCILMLTSSLTSVPTVCKLLSGLKDGAAAVPNQFGRFYFRITMYGTAVFYGALLIFIPWMTFFEAEAIQHVTHCALYSWDYGCFLISWISFDIVSWATLAQLAILGGTVYFEFRAVEQELLNLFGSSGGWHWSPMTVKVVDSSKNSTSVPFHVGKLKNLYVHLIGVGEHLNQTYNTRVLLMVGLNTTLLCFVFFTLLLNLDQIHEAPPLSSVVPWLAMRLIPLYMSIYPFCAIQSKAHDILTTIHVWITKVENENILHELEKFATQIKNRKLYLTAHGFFKLDNSTFSSIMNNAISYLIIIVQFHMMFRTWFENKSLLSSSSSSSGFEVVNSTNASSFSDLFMFANSSGSYDFGVAL